MDLINRNTTPPAPVGQIQSLPQAATPELLVGPNQRIFKTDTLSILRLFILPIVVIVVFLLFLLLGIIPNITQIFSNLDNVIVLNSTYDSKLVELSKLDEISRNSATIQSDLNLVNKLAALEPTSAVVKFQEKIVDLARGSGLKALGQQSGEKIITSTIVTPSNPTLANAGLGIIEIPSEFTFEGQLAKVKDFVGKLNSIDDFVIIGQIEILAVQKPDEPQADLDEINWQLQLKLLKYQFLPVTAEVRKSFLTISLDTRPEQKVVDFVNNRN